MNFRKVESLDLFIHNLYAFGSVKDVSLLIGSASLNGWMIESDYAI